MCGRYILTTDAHTLGRLFDAAVRAELEPRYNIAPSQPVPVVRVSLDTKRRTLDLLHWGLIPHWADDPKIGYRMINARSESAAKKPAYRAALRYRRCILPCDGSYEWNKLESGGKQPHLIRMQDQSPFALAGLWEHWQDPEGNEIDSCTILTTEPNDLVREIHDRMPAILPREAVDAWLDPDRQDPAELTPLLRPLPAERMAAVPVSTRVNSPKNEGPACIAPITDESNDPPEQGELF